MKAIILAAGAGVRLRSITSDPKCLFKINSSTILERQVKLLRKFKIKDIYVVLGYKAKKIKDFSKEKNLNLHFIPNERWWETENLYSFFLALKKVKGEVLLLNGDVVFDERELQKLLSCKKDICLLERREMRMAKFTNWGRKNFEKQLLAHKNWENVRVRDFKKKLKNIYYLKKSYFCKDLDYPRDLTKILEGLKGMEKIQIRNLSKSFEDLKVLENVDLEVNEGEFICIVGPSGCRKTTFLKILAGFESYEGQVLVDGKEVLKPGPDRFVVFQEFNQLLPWKTVYKNIEYGLKLKGIKEREKKVKEIISLVGLEGFEKSYPHQLSGGMKQRVAIGRALVMDPSVLLMDEPFGSLDAQLRRKLREEILRIHEKIGKTIIFITHNIRESIILGDRVIVFSKSPAHVEGIFHINLPKGSTREQDNPTIFGRLFKEIYKILEKTK